MIYVIQKIFVSIFLSFLTRLSHILYMAYLAENTLSKLQVLELLLAHGIDLSELRLKSSFL